MSTSSDSETERQEGALLLTWMLELQLGVEMRPAVWEVQCIAHPEKKQKKSLIVILVHRKNTNNTTQCSWCTSKVWKYLDMTFPNLATVYLWASSFCFRAFSTLLHRMTTTSSRPDTTATSFPNITGSACWDDKSRLDFHKLRHTVHTYFNILPHEGCISLIFMDIFGLWSIGLIKQAVWGLSDEFRK